METIFVCLFKKIIAIL